MNPAFGKWPQDSDPAEGAEPDWGEITEPESCFPLGWDLRNRAPRRPVPCRVTVGGWELEGVIFPVHRRTRAQVKALAEEAVRTRGHLEGPFAYPVPSWFRGKRTHLVGLYRYYLARVLLKTP